MKPCGACDQLLARESFSKKQWQTKERRRCKNCIANDRLPTDLKLASMPLGETASNVTLPELRSSNLRMPGRDDNHGVQAWTDEDLFREPPPREDCPICFIRLPLRTKEITYQSCCGKFICIGCVYAFHQQSPGEYSSCPFCRTPESLTEQEENERLMKRAKDNDPDAMRNLGSFYRGGLRGLTRDQDKAMELLLRAGELGSAESYCAIGKIYEGGEGVEVNMKKAKHYYALAAIGGYAPGRFNLGSTEYEKGDTDRAVKHYMISAGCGYDLSIATIRQLYTAGCVSKGDFENALRAYGEAMAQTKSEQREAAAADPRFMQSFR